MPSAFLKRNITTEILMNDVIVMSAKGTSASAVMTRIRVAGLESALFIIEKPRHPDAERVADLNDFALADALRSRINLDGVFRRAG